MRAGAPAVLDAPAASQLNQDLDLVAWWYACPVSERAVMRELAWNSPDEAARCFAGIAHSVHLALVWS
jgi:hypothetical protein